MLNDFENTIQYKNGCMIIKKFENQLVQLKTLLLLDHNDY